MERSTFKKQREHTLKKSVNRPILLQADFSNLHGHQHLSAMHLLQRWQELKDRELTAQQHNKQLLQQFDEAQDTLREMLTLTAAMKTIRMEYERYLEESSPHWQQQLKEKTRAAQRKNTQDGATKSSADQPLLSQNSYNQDGSPHLPYMQSSWQTHPQSQARCPIRVPYHPFQLHHLASMPGHHHPWPRQNPQGQASLQPDYPRSWTAGIPSGSEALWGQLYVEEPPAERGVPQVVGEEAETSRAPRSKGERGGGSRSSHLSQELDIKPVRLSSCPAESSESSRESSQASREKRKKREKRGRSQRTSSGRERRSSQDSSKPPSTIVTAAVIEAQSSESGVSSEEGRTNTRRRRKSAGLAVGLPRFEKAAKERTRNNGGDSGSHKEESQSSSEESRSEKAGDQSHDDKSESCTEESGSQKEETSGSVRIKIKNGDLSSSSEGSSVGEKDEEELEHEKYLGEGDEEADNDKNEDTKRDEEQEERDVEDDVSERKHTTEEEEETGAEEEMEEQESEEEGDQEEKSDRLKNDEKGKQGSTSSQDEEEDEDESEGGEDKTEKDGESDEEEEGGREEEEEGADDQKRDEAGQAEEESDSEDSIISPQNKSKKLHIIPEEPREDEDEEEGSKPGNSDEDSNEFSDDDIEHLLAPQEQSQKKEEKELKADEKPKAFCDKAGIFQVETERSTKTDHPSDSEEFDHFYD